MKPKLVSEEHLHELADEVASELEIDHSDDHTPVPAYDAALAGARAVLKDLDVVRVIDTHDGDVWGVKVQPWDLREGAVLVRFTKDA